MKSRSILAFFAAALFAISAAAQGIQINQLPPATTPLSPGDLFIVSQGGATRSVALSNITPSITCSLLPALTGDVTTSVGSCATTVAKIDGFSVSIAGPWSMAGAFSFAGTLTGPTAVAFPTSGTLATLANINSALPSITTSQLYGGTAGAGIAQAVSVGPGLSLTANTLSATTTATVSSVALALPSSILTVSGSPVTTTGTLTGSLATQTANFVWSGPVSGSAATPTFRALVGADLPNPGASSLGGIESYASVSHQWINAISTGGVPSSTQPAFTDISGTLGLGAGGTGQTTAPTARAASGLNIDAVTKHGDSIYTILATDRVVETNASLSTSRVWTLPAASALNPGQSLCVLDAAGGVTSGNTIVITRAGSDTINGATTYVLNFAFAGVCFYSDGSSTWSFNASATGGSVTSVAFSIPNAPFTISGSPVTTTGTLTATPNGTSGGIVCFTATTTMASSAALTANAPLIGGGAGACPTGLSIVNNAVFVTNGSGVPAESTTLPAGLTLSSFFGTGRTYSGTTDTLASTDCGTIVQSTGSSAVTETLPNSLPANCSIAVEQSGSAQITFSPASGATLHSAHSYTKTVSQYGVITLVVIGNSGGTSAVYTLAGDGA